MAEAHPHASMNPCVAVRKTRYGEVTVGACGVARTFSRQPLHLGTLKRLVVWQFRESDDDCFFKGIQMAKADSYELSFGPRSQAIVEPARVLEATVGGVSFECFAEQAVDVFADVNRAKVVMSGQDKGVAHMFETCRIFLMVMFSLPVMVVLEMVSPVLPGVS